MKSIKEDDEELFGQYAYNTWIYGRTHKTPITIT